MCNCNERATCYKFKGCVCDSGWSGVTCSDDVNECEGMASVCPGNLTCQNNPGSFVCVCSSGFEKVNNYCVDIDECAVSTKNTCQQVCTNTGGSYVCSCHAGYTYYAANNTCVACADNHWGVNCSQICDCGDRGTCHRVKGCVCHSGWSGVTCSDDINECQMAAPCPASQICRNNPGSFVCVCPSGFVKESNTCVDIDECAVSTKNTCQQVCTNTVGSYVCSCHAGYTYFAANNTCVDIDECAVSTKNTCQQVCTNTGGSYVCSCHAGYTYYAANNTCVGHPRVRTIVNWENPPVQNGSTVT
ncbi:hypothetical protein ACOMHN_023670 [Nucella lapillus]